MGNPTESTYRRLFTIAKYIRLYHNSKIYQNEYNNISKYQTISLYQNISASKINITIMGTISEIYHVSCEWVKNREAEVHRAKYKGCGKVKLKDRGFNFNCHIANYINISKYQL